MSKIPTITESQLGSLNPAGLDEDFLARLTASAEGTYTSLSADEASLEDKLRAFRPRTIPAGLHASLLKSLGDTPFAVDEKIVLFNKPAAGTTSNGKTRGAFRLNLAAAAAVALLGAIAAFLVPSDTAKNESAQTEVPLRPETVTLAPQTLPAFPASPIAPASRNLSDTRDEGVVWRGKNQPHRVLRLTYMDQVTVMDAEGNPIPTQRPRVEYVIIPEKID